MNPPDINFEIARLSRDQQNWLNLLISSDPGPLATHLYRPVDDVSRIRLVNLVRYLRTVRDLGSRVALVGEAPGHIGTRRTGIPFMSETMVRGEQAVAQSFVARAGFICSIEDLPARREVSSTIVWSTLDELARPPFLWAAFPHHPHQADELDSNRTPTASEIEAAREILEQFVWAFEIETVIAVGGVAERVLTKLGVTCDRVRHPARGGGAEFRRAVLERLSSSVAENEKLSHD